MQIHQSPFQPQSFVEAANFAFGFKLQDQEFLPEKEVEEQRHARGFSELSDPQEGAVQELLGHNDVSTSLG
jgi:ribosomal protein L5